MLATLIYTDNFVIKGPMFWNSVVKTALWVTCFLHFQGDKFNFAQFAKISMYGQSLFLLLYTLHFIHIGKVVEKWKSFTYFPYFRKISVKVGYNTEYVSIRHSLGDTFMISNNSISFDVQLNMLISILALIRICQLLILDLKMCKFDTN